MNGTVKGFTTAAVKVAEKKTELSVLITPHIIEDTAKLKQLNEEMNE